MWPSQSGASVRSCAVSPSAPDFDRKMPTRNLSGKRSKGVSWRFDELRVGGDANESASEPSVSMPRFLVAILNEQLIPALIRQNWGNLDEVPFVEVEIPRPQRDQEMALRDKVLFQDMGLPVSLQYLYERHRVPSPDPGGALFPCHRPGPNQEAAPASTSNKASACRCCDPIDARSEGALQLAARQQAAIAAFPGQLAEADAAGDYLVWDATLDDRTTDYCRDLHGRRWGEGWFLPPPAHFNCRSELVRVPKAILRDESKAVKALDALPVNPVLTRLISGTEDPANPASLLARQEQKLAAVRAAHPTADFSTLYAKAKAESPELFR